MRERGRLTEWNDERGFGFITPLGGGAKVFVHVTEFPHDLRRPIATDLVTYELGRDQSNRIRAEHVAFLTPAHARHEEEPAALSAFEIGLPAAFALLLVALTGVGLVPPGVFAFYVAASLVAFCMYWSDKVAATRGHWRTSEAALLGIAAVGGWPGAFVARHLFRHKTRKQPFRTFFWITVAMNCGFLAVFLIELRRAPG